MGLLNKYGINMSEISGQFDVKDVYDILDRNSGRFLKKDNQVVFNDDFLREYLSIHWNMPYDKIFVVVYYRDILVLDNSVWINKFYHPYKGDELTYPLTGLTTDAQSIFLAPDKYNIIKYKAENGIFLMILSFSPTYEREKHLNPLQLQVDSYRELKSMEDIELYKDSEGNILITKSIVESVIKENSQEIENGINANKEKLNDLEKVVEETEEQHQILLNDIQEKNSNLEELIHNIKDCKNEIERLIELRDNMDKEIAKELQQKANKLLQLGLLDDDKFKQLTGVEKKYTLEEGSYITYDDIENNPANLINHIQAYLYKKGIMYEKELLMDFYALLQTNDFIVLAGDSGTGKTSLVKYFADAIGGIAKIIPVKPNWTGSEDLLGYYNPIEKRFLSTEFTEAIREAGENPDIPYFICLDEMNLARVEYYFADFLSLLEEWTKNIEIQLYSDNENKNNLKEIYSFIDILEYITQKTDKGSDYSYLDMMQDNDLNNEIRKVFGLTEKESLISYYIHLRNILNNAFTIQPKIEIPNNVRFFGAINIDETTNYLSPKILDRAHIIRFKSPFLSLNKDYGVDTEYEYIDKKIKLTPIQLGLRKEYPEFRKDDEFVNNILILVEKYLLPMGVEFSFRTIRQGMNYNNICHELNIDKYLILNNYIIHKILPKLTFDGNKKIDDKTTKIMLLENMLQELKTILSQEDNQYKDVIEELVNVISRAKNNQDIVNYWA